MNEHPHSSAPRAAYLTHLNGLRALAIIAVLIYHLRATYCPAGYFGVDIFLVLSGFLLFRSLLKEENAANFNYGSFLLKKSWRLLPVWFIVTLVACSGALYLFADYLRIDPVLRTAASSATLCADYYIDSSGDYFNAYTQQNPLLHYWYLSITQQLYLVAPLLVVPLVRWCSRRAACILLALLALLSLVYYILTTVSGLLPDTSSRALLAALDTKSAYYHLIPRFWEITAGVVVLLLPAWNNRHILRQALALLALAALIVSFYLYETGSPSIYLPVIATILALRYADSGIAARLLGLKPLQAIGTISFSLYLWHWPIMVFWKYYTFDSPGAWDEVGMVTLSLLLATLSWYTLERLPMPSRKGWAGTLMRSCVLLLLPIVYVGATHMNKHERKLEEEQANINGQHRNVELIRVYKPEINAETLRGLEKMKELGLDRDPLHMGDANIRPSFLLMGDSHATQIYSALDEACTKEGIAGLNLNNSLAPFWNITQYRIGVDPYCWNPDIAHMFIEYLKQHPEIRVVLISQAWLIRLEPMRESVNSLTGKKYEPGQERLQAAITALGEMCDQIRAVGKVPVLLGDAPYHKLPAPIDEWERCEKLGKQWRERWISEIEHKNAQGNTYWLMNFLEQAGRARHIDLAPALKIGNGYRARIDGKWMYTDTHHLSYEGSQRAVNLLMPQLLSIIQQQTDEKEVTASSAEHP